MAGDTPTPIGQRKEGTPFYGETVEIDFHKGNDTLIPFDEVQERRNVNSAFAPSAAGTPEMGHDNLEFIFPPRSVAEIVRLTQEIIRARAEVMDPADTPFLR